jgi:tryptophan synthase beta chain
MGIFKAFAEHEPETVLYGVEAAGHGLETGQHSATLTKGKVGVLHGARSYVLADEAGQILEAHSVSAGLDYPGVGPEHAFFHDTGRATYLTATDDEALDTVLQVARCEGILIALETAHAFAALPEVARRVAEKKGRPARILVNVSGRGDKDLATVLARRGDRLENAR